MLPRHCANPRCSIVVPAGGRFCHDHARHEAKRVDQRRGSAHSRGYGAAWRRLRAVVLADEPLCRSCREDGVVEAATDVDHIIPKSKGGTDARANLQPLCHRCHSAKTMAESVRVLR